MNAKQLDKKFVANTYARADVLFVSGRGSTLYDDEGRSYIDFGTGIAVNIMGHGYEPWIKATSEQLGKIAHTSNLYYSEPAAYLAEKLCKRTGAKKVFFSNSGAEANECAIKCARKYSFDRYGAGRSKILTLDGSFHGRTITTLSATGQEMFHKYFDPFTGGFDYIKPGDTVDLQQKVSAGDVAAIMIELVQGESGVNVLGREFADKIAEICAERDILLIVDEVQTGNGRTGRLYSYELYGLHPDIVTTAKGLGGGLPLGATIMFGKCENTFTPGTHGSTFGGNPVACAGACAILDGINDELLADVRRKGEKLMREIGGMRRVKEVTGLGLMIGVEAEGATAGEYAAELRSKGLVVLTAKHRLRLLPALNIGEAELNKGINIMKEVLDKQ